ncbi:MAG: hypothetical protein AAF928_14935, partial [Myxococcota bacterium]
ALARAAEALRLVGVDDAPSAAHALVRDEARHFLARAAARGRTFDLIVLDPPSFATHRQKRKRTTWRVARDMPELVAHALRVLAPGGTILACTNHRQSAASTVRGWLLEGAARADVAVALEPLPPPPDCPVAPGAPPHLKRFFISRQR